MAVPFNTEVQFVIQTLFVIRYSSQSCQWDSGWFPPGNSHQ